MSKIEKTMIWVVMIIVSAAHYSACIHSDKLIARHQKMNEPHYVSFAKNLYFFEGAE